MTRQADSLKDDGEDGENRTNTEDPSDLVIADREAQDAKTSGIFERSELTGNRPAENYKDANAAQEDEIYDAGVLCL